MIEPNNAVLGKMLDRLFASMVSGPAMNCRPQASRQRVDLAQLAKFKDVDPGAAFLALLQESKTARLAARAQAPAKGIRQRGAAIETDEEADELLPEEKAARTAWAEQQSLLTKLRVIADDSRTYEQDTGVFALSVGFPLLSLPPGSFGGRGGITTRRIVAPIAFIPVSLTVKTGARQTIEMACRGEGVDRVIPNLTLLSWLEQQTGQPLAEKFTDEEGTDPWREIAELVRAVAQRVELAVPAMFATEVLPAELVLSATPRAEEDARGPAILNAAVLGLFPSANQGLLRDTREMLAGGAPEGPIESFVRHGVSLDIKPEVQPEDQAPAEAAPEKTPEPAIFSRTFAEERLVAASDPCQSRAVRLARQARGLVVHGPPGTGKSQTIANIIGDHLARGERVLFVCDKRTALDVVADRLRGLGLGALCATVHDPQRDQREFYRSVREQLDNLADTAIPLYAPKKLAKVDAELQTLHDELTQYYRQLMCRDGPHQERGGPGSFHNLMGQWLNESGEAGIVLDERALQGVQPGEWEQNAGRLKEVLERGDAVGYATNPWKLAAGIDLPRFMADPMDVYRNILATCLKAAEQTDATADAHQPPFESSADLMTEAARRQQIAQTLQGLADLPAASAGYWVKQPAVLVAKTKAEFEAAAGWVAQVKAAPLDNALRQASPVTPPADQISAELKAISDYAAAFDARAAEYARVKAAVPEAETPTVLRWMVAEPKTAAAARKRLDGAASLATEVEATTPDASLLARFEAAPIEPAKMVEFLASLSTYLDIADKWSAFLQFGKKKAAEPAVRYFGLSLNAANAGNVRQFLSQVQKRQDLRAAVEAATGPRFEKQPEDAELLAAYKQHRGVLAAIAAGSQKAVGASVAESSHGASHGAPPDPAVVLALNGLLGPQSQAAKTVLDRFQLPTDSANAHRIADFLRGLEARVLLAALLWRAAPGSTVTTDDPDERALKLFELHERLLGLLTQAPVGTPVGSAVGKALTDPAQTAAIINALAHADERAAAILSMEKVLLNAGIFHADYLKSTDGLLRDGGRFTEPAIELRDRLDTLEGVLRIRDGLARLSPTLSAAAAKLMAVSTGCASGYSAIRRNVLAGEITRRLQAAPNLQGLDAHRLQNAFDRFRHLSGARQPLVRDLIQHHWVTKQKERLLVGTHTRLNATGADLRRRLTIRGERAMRLRQVIAHGAGVEGGDPLFDLRPVWMASPETVAQLFPRKPIFDVVVFDEASQCRLEEALPVLTRANRVVIAGDPKQLPPTRFFESAVVASDAEETETDQELFESQQGEVEDLLTAALGLDIHQSYLDVHYRSRNADLIGFSNEHFYGSRLQAIPAHPRNRTQFAPITLYRVAGVYEKRKNAAEAEQVCKIVRDLLKRATPPSIGIACFNLVQRDLIVETLEAMADEDDDFATKLAEARERRGPSTSEGLFVKNLENVQGDERDHLIVSTTYGPDAAGKFRRQFGPLGTAGGGRRLNVLITRARNELHLVTSIPRPAYGSLPELPPGMTPSGGWLLFAYLLYAEQLQKDYELSHRALESIQNAPPAADDAAQVHPRAARNPSAFASALAHRLAQRHRHGSDVPWGNEGFCVDLAIHHPTRAEDVTVGVLCDMNRYAASDDPVEWEVFRTAMHESQGWTLHRVWTPHFFRDPAGALRAIDKGVLEAVAAERTSPARETPKK